MRGNVVEKFCIYVTSVLVTILLVTHLLHKINSLFLRQ